MRYWTNPGKYSIFMIHVAYKYIDFLFTIFTYYAKRFGVNMELFKLVCNKKCVLKVDFDSYTVLSLTVFAGLMEMGVCFSSYMQTHISFKFVINELYRLAIFSGSIGIWNFLGILFSINFNQNLNIFCFSRIPTFHWEGEGGSW